jgi:hypothetical protein
MKVRDRKNFLFGNRGSGQIKKYNPPFLWAGWWVSMREEVRRKLNVPQHQP